MARQEYLYLTTIGRRTGLHREIEIWFTERDGRYYVIAEHGLVVELTPDRMETTHGD